VLQIKKAVLFRTAFFSIAAFFQAVSFFFEALQDAQELDEAFFESLI